MSAIPAFPGRYDRAIDLANRDPQREAHHIYRALAQLEFPWDMRIGLNLALCRTFAAPRVAALLGHTGQVEADATKRVFDTGLFMYELIDSGPHHFRGREIVRRLNRMHHRFDIENEDYLYVLATFVVVPTRWIDEFGWRATTPTEREATHFFYRTLGRLMNIRELPTSYQGFADVLDDYERAHLAYSAAGAAQMAATTQAIGDQLPRALRPMAPELTSALFDEDLARTLRLPELSAQQRRLIRAGVRARSALARRWVPRSSPWFVPGSAQRAVYPRGYRLDDLGPDSARPGSEDAVAGRMR